MTGSTSPKPVDTRPVPLFVQGVAVGMATALVPFALVALLLGSAWGTSLSTVATLAVAFGIGCFIPIPESEAVEREQKRRERMLRHTTRVPVSPAPQRPSLSVVPPAS